MTSCGRRKSAIGLLLRSTESYCRNRKAIPDMIPDAHEAEPWSPEDDIRSAGWMPAFAASCVLIGLRAENVIGDQQIALVRSYWGELAELVKVESVNREPNGRAHMALKKLLTHLTPEELRIIGTV